MKHLVYRAMHRSVLLILLSSLIACGGEEITDFIDASDLRLSEITVVSGGTLLLNESEVEEFNPNSAGPYRIDLDDQNSESIQLSVELASSVRNARLQLIEVEKAADDRNRVSSITSGESFSVELDQGDNQVFIRVSSTESAARMDYVININRVSSSAALQEISINNILGTSSRSTDNGTAEFSTGFESDIYTYDIAIDRRLCGVDIVPQPESRFATVEINGEEVKWLDSYFVPLQVGETSIVTVELTSEDESTTQTYTFNLTKNDPTDEELEADARLISLDLANSNPISEFKCSAISSSYRVNEVDLAGLALTAEFFDHQVDASIRIGLRNEEEISAVMVEGTEVNIEAGVPYTGDLLSEFGEVGDINYDEDENGSKTILVEVTPPNGNANAAVTFQVVISLADRNEVYVDTVDELQSALRNASANDEIIVAEGDYLGVPSDTVDATGSGNLLAHFFSNQSGTLDEPIILRAEDGEVNLMGDDLASNSVFLLQGDNWEIENINFTTAQNGVVFDSANQISLRRFEITNIGERGISVQNTASDISIDQGSINRTGLSPEVRVGIDEVYGEGIVIGADDAASQNISIHRVNFGRDIAEEHIEVKATSEAVRISSNHFDSDNTLATPVTDRTLVRLSGGDTVLTYNTFEFSPFGIGSDDIVQIIKSETTDGSAVIEVEQNQLDLSGQAINFVNNTGSASVTVIENARVDALNIVNVGDVVDASIPTYQIQSTIDPTQCLTTVGNNSEPVELQTCEAVGEQFWTFEHSDNGFVYMVQRDTSIFTSETPVFGLNSVPTSVVVDPIFIDDDENAARNGYLFHWLVKRDGDAVHLINRANLGVFLTQVEPDDDSETVRDNDIVGYFEFDTLVPDFTLVRQ